MANHVNTHIHFERLNDAGVAKLKDLYSLIREGESRDPCFGDLWGVIPEVSDSQEWMYENVGSKWCYFEDRGEDSMHLVSAWYYPEEGIAWLLKQLGEVDPDVLAHVTYEDEMPNFFGCWFFDKDGIVDGHEWNDEEIQEIMKENIPELAELNEEETERYWGLWSDNVWDVVYEAQYKVYQSIKESLE